MIQTFTEIYLETMFRIEDGARFPSGPLLRTFEEIDDVGGTHERALHVSSARVVIARYALLQHDFPELRTTSLLERFPHQRASREETSCWVRTFIDDWLIRHAAVVSTSQAAPNNVNSTISLDGDSKTAFRPSRYGRSLVVAIDRVERPSTQSHAGLLDLKGVGVAPKTIPTHSEHSDGLEYLGVALSDLVIQHLLDHIFQFAEPGLWTVPTYAVLDLGFNIVDGWRGTEPAGAHVRRAHRRPVQAAELPLTGSKEEEVKFRTEMLLRSYGLTSAASGSSYDVNVSDSAVSLSYGGKPVVLEPAVAELVQTKFPQRSKLRVEGVNLQLSREAEATPLSAQMVDFGHLNVRRAFVHPVASLVRDRALRLGHIVMPAEPGFVQPNPWLAIDPDKYGRMCINEFCFDLARKFRNGESDSDAVVQSLNEYLAPLLLHWASVRDAVQV